MELFPPATIATIFTVIREAVEKLESAMLDPSHTIGLHAGLLRSILDNSTPRPSVSPSGSDWARGTDRAFNPLEDQSPLARSSSTMAAVHDLPSPFLRPPSPLEVHVGTTGGSGLSTRSADASLGGGRDTWHDTDSDGWLEDMRGSVGVGGLDYALLNFDAPN